MRCLCINLDRSPDRWASIQKQAEAIGLRIERSPAVDGRSLANPPGFPVSAGAIGCFLSHRACWDDIGRGADDHVLVLEDDALLSPTLPNFLDDPSWLPDDADLVHLGAADNRCFVQGLGRAARDRTLYRSVRCTGAEAYIITRRCAAYLARNLTSIDREFDQILFGGGRPELKIYKILPAPCTQDRAGIKSTIERPQRRIEDAEAMRRNRRLAHLRIRITGLARLARRKAVDYR